MRSIWLLALVLVVGAASLGGEVATARLLAPWFGDSTLIWANTIATVLLALSCGYRLGGHLADRRPTRRRLAALVLAAACLFALVPFAARPFLRHTVEAFQLLSVGTFVGSLLAVLALVALPMLLLGTVAPFALRLAFTRIEDAGTVAGRLYAISTVGSLAGVFLSALLLVPFAGTRRTFLVFALALALVAVASLERRWALAPLAIGALLALPVGTLKAAPDGRVIWERETPYEYARVVETPDGERRLELNEGFAVHSVYRPGAWLTGGYWDEPAVAPLAVRAGAPRSVAMLGDAAGTTARIYGHYFPRTRVDGVELDGALHDVGRRLFDLHGPRLHLHTSDARVFLERSERRWDAIVVDVYHQPYVPFQLATREFFALARERLTADGVLLMDVAHPPGSDTLERALSATIGDVFAHVMRDPVGPYNTVLLAAEAPISTRRLLHAARSAPRDLRPLARAAARRLAPALTGGEVLTDDRAPVEWLTDASLLEAIAEGDG
ncbi:MAG TPA: fused MFS/spermidine synthase [Conexibacter sp.]|nr:fused MFS/spermidine synthase [Conexibacter sp.]